MDTPISETLQVRVWTMDTTISGEFMLNPTGESMDTPTSGQFMLHTTGESMDYGHTHQ